MLGNLCAFTLVTNCLLRTVKTVLLHNWKNRFHHSFTDFCKKCSAEKCQHPHLANKLLHYRLCESGALGEDAHPFQGGHFAQCGPEALLQLYVGLLYPENYRHRKILQSAFPLPCKANRFVPPILEIFKCAHHEQTHRYATSEHQILRQEMREKEQIKYISYFCKCKHLYLCNMHSSIRKMV